VPCRVNPAVVMRNQRYDEGEQTTQDASALPLGDESSQRCARLSLRASATVRLTGPTQPQAQ